MNSNLNEDKRHKISRIILITIILTAFGLTLFPFVGPLLVAALFAFAFEPHLAKYSSIKKGKRGLQTSLIIFGLFICVTAPVVLIAIRLTQKFKEIGTGGVQNLPIYKSLEKAYAGSQGLAHKANLDLNTLVGDPNDIAVKIGKHLLDCASAMATNAPDFILGLFIFGCAFYYFMTEGKTLHNAIMRAGLLPQGEIDEVISVIQKSSYSTLFATTLIGGIQATVVAVAGLIFGYHEFLIIFLITFFTSFIPVIGAAPIAFALAIFSLILGETWPGIGLLVAALVAGSIDNLIKPLIISGADEVDIHPVVGLLTIIGSVIVYGIPGLLLGPVLTSMVYSVVPRLFNAYKAKLG